MCEVKGHQSCSYSCLISSNPVDLEHHQIGPPLLDLISQKVNFKEFASFLNLVSNSTQISVLAIEEVKKSC